MTPECAVHVCSIHVGGYVVNNVSDACGACMCVSVSEGECVRCC